MRTVTMGSVFMVTELRCMGASVWIVSAQSLKVTLSLPEISSTMIMSKFTIKEMFLQIIIHR